MSNRSLELATAAVLFFLGTAISVGALGLGLWSQIGLASGSVPMAGGLLLAGLSVFNFVRALGIDIVPGRVTGRDALSIGGVAVASLLYLGVVDHLGMILPLPFYLVAVSLCVEWRTDPKWLLSLFAGWVVFAVCCHFVFKVFLHMLIPPGPFGF